MKTSGLKGFIIGILVAVTTAALDPRARADLFVSSQTDPTPNSILRYDGVAGSFLGVFAKGGNDLLGMTFGPDGNLYVASGNTDQVLRFDGKTGAALGVFASGGGLVAPINVTFGPDGNLYVSSSYSQILRYDGMTGAFIDAFVSDNRLAYPRGLKFGPDGNLYVASYNNASVLRYSGTTGAFLNVFVPSQSGGLYTPSDLVFGPDGNLYVTGGAFPYPGVFRYDGRTGAFINQFAKAPVANQMYPIGLAFGPDGNLYVVASGSIFAVVRFNGRSGDFMDYFVSNMRGGLSNPWGIAFSPETNGPPSISCPPPSTAECGRKAQVTVEVNDPEGDALTVLWTVNGVVFQTNTLTASRPPAATPVSFSAELPPGANTVSVMAIDTANNLASCSTVITVGDTTPPVIVSASAQPAFLWPPNHRLVDVRVHARANDSCSSTSWKIVKVRSNEAMNGKGNRHEPPDWIITGDHTVKLRAVKSTKKSDRIYLITIQATDAFGNRSQPSRVTVTVPHH